MLLYIDMFMESETTKSLSEAGIDYTFAEMDIEKCIIKKIKAITPIFDDKTGEEHSEIHLGKNLTLYSPLKVSDILQIIKEESTIWQRKN